MRKRSVGDLIAGKFRLEKYLARGGMGEVWAARNLQLGAPVALKLMSAHAIASADLVVRFAREAQAAARLRHANVVTVHEHGVFEGVPFIAMELLDGEDLSTRLKTRGRLPYAEACCIVNAVCKALRRAHEMGIVHRDLKPANIFLARQDDDEIIKVLDFGIAKILHDVQGAVSTKAGTFLGSAYYVSPEQAGNGIGKVDHRVDLWALGVIIFRMLTGKLPFGADSHMNVIIRICTEPPPRASSIVPELDAATDGFFIRALGRHPDDRFQSAKEMAEAFTALGARTPQDAASSTSPPTPPAISLGPARDVLPSPARDGAPPPVPPPARPAPAPGQTAPVSAPVVSPRGAAGSGAAAVTRWSPATAVNVPEGPPLASLSRTHTTPIVVGAVLAAVLVIIIVVGALLSAATSP